MGEWAAMGAVGPVLRGAGRPDGLRAWGLGGRVVSLAASLGAVRAVWLFARRLFNWRVFLIKKYILILPIMRGIIREPQG